jgi:hypothetical protein
LPPTHRVYIDEAGDRGLKFGNGSTRFFTVGAVIVRDDDEASVRQQLAVLRSELGRAPGDTLHFQKLTHTHRRRACRTLADLGTVTVATVTICKRTITDPATGSATQIATADGMYLYALRMLLERVSWFIRDSPDAGTGLVTIAHLKRFTRAHLDDYVAKLRSSSSNVAWASFGDHPFKISTPGILDMLQVADIAVSGVFKALEPDKFGETERQYLERLAPAIYRRGGKPTTYGLKVFPASLVEELGWLNTI